MKQIRGEIKKHFGHILRNINYLQNMFKDEIVKLEERKLDFIRIGT